MQDEFFKILSSGGDLTLGVIGYLVFKIRKDLNSIAITMAEISLRQHYQDEKVSDISDRVKAQESKCDRDGSTTSRFN